MKKRNKVKDKVLLFKKNTIHIWAVNDYTKYKISATPYCFFHINKKQEQFWKTKLEKHEFKRG